MDQRPNVSLENSSKPSKILALFALVIAFALPFILVKSFPHKQKANYDTEEQHRLKIEELDKPHLQEVETTKQSSPLNTPSSVKPTEKDRATSTSTNTSPIKSPLNNTKAQPINSSKPAPPKAKPPITQKPVVNTPNSTADHENELKTIKTRAGDSLATVFSRLGLSPQILQAIIRDNPHTKAFSKLKPNEQLQFLIKKHQLEKMIIPFTSTQYLVVYREGHHYKSKINSYKVNTHNHFVTATVRGSLYSTAKQHNIPYKLMQQMTEIFAWDINFAKDVRAGDHFTIIYKAFYIEDKLVGTGDIVAVSYRNRGSTFQAVLHTDRSGHSDYFNPQGVGLKKAFNRYPLRFSHISSTFSLARNHPILRYKRAHKGVDLAAPIGTPILATGNGNIEIIGRQSGYGNMIKIKHNKTYSTIYGHMLRFQKGF